ncbi:hypothetical protein N9F81_00700 [Candidatus Pelagibacter sp.]|mgnify:FL=1|jgi:hypothetical protein|nr:hypothetical protein [Candidatus Pelagibacter sp.]MDA8691158.1 hypothetical protein [Candidatus Pelagibacter bacterium]MDA9931242.1 hypothetical protein [bacterium]MDC1415781.1 hypothetical protein [Pelagibacteraceae bacterium]MDA8809380.1 hypothetical protein [Candidatus Pelagibacter bacterium]|tara:strand:- start:358 stop:552 length:195 start_codon:yes stop_codon:yes gene_type:complete
MKKNLFNFNKNNSSNASGSQVGQITCEPCANECKKIEIKINNRKLSDIKSEEIDHLINVFSKED